MAGRVAYAMRDFVDRQLVDRSGRPSGVVDDLELDVPDDGLPAVTAILAGPGALGARLGGVLGRWLTAATDRLADRDGGPVVVPMHLVTDIDRCVHLAGDRDDLGTSAAEIWLARHLIGRIPGGHRAPQ